MAQLLSGVKLAKGTDNVTTADADVVLKDKIVGLYFSAHWCPPCREFTPVLKDFYNELKEAGENFEIVFVSSDRSESDLKAYLKECHGDWYYIPFGNDKIQALDEHFEVCGIPTLVIIKADGTIINEDACEEVATKAPARCLSAWKKA